MKKSIIIIAAICITNFVFAQDTKKAPQHSLGARIATLTALQNQSIIGNAIANPFLAIFSGVQITDKATAQYGLSYGFDASELITINITGARQEVKSYRVENSSLNDYPYTAKTETLISTIKQTSIVGKVDFNYINSKNVTCYSGIGVGLGLYEIKSANNPFIITLDDTKKQRPIFHIAAFGIKTKGKVSFFSEFGIGALGMLSAGINVRF
jgi:hypothetical protein